MSIAGPVTHCVLIFFLDLTQALEVKTPLEVGTVISSVSCYGALFLKTPAVSGDGQHDAIDPYVAARYLASHID